MIRFCNKRSRSLDGSKSSGVYVQVEVTLRDHLAKFKGARLGVFLAIALHSDEDGWSKPGIDLISRETGYNRDTISAAITELDQLTIEGHRVMLVYQTSIQGRFFRNKYLIFPTPEEAEMLAKAKPRKRTRKRTRKQKPPILQNSPSLGFPDTEKPDTEKLEPEKPEPEKPEPEKPTHEEEPVFKKNHDREKPPLEKNHEEEQPAPSSSSSQVPPRTDDDDDGVKAFMAKFKSSNEVASEVLEFYTLITGNVANVRDRDAFRDVRDADTLAWKIAICRGVILSRERVRSLAYFVPIVEELLGGPDVGEEYLRYVISKLPAAARERAQARAEPTKANAA